MLQGAACMKSRNLLIMLLASVLMLLCLLRS
jgi:hypothetical protein